MSIRGEGRAVSSVGTSGESIGNVTVTNVREAFVEFTNVTGGRIARIDGEARVSESREVDVVDSRLTATTGGGSLLHVGEQRRRKPYPQRRNERDLRGANIEVSAAAETPAPPSGYGALGYYVTARSLDPSGRGSWFAPTVGYDEAAASEVDEDTIRFWRYGDDVYAPLGELENAPGVDSEGSETDSWRRIEGINNVGGVNDVDPEGNVVYTNITNLGAENRLVFRDQVTDGANVTVEAVSLPRPGFVVITDDRGEICGVSEYLSAGVHADVVVPLSEPLDGDATLTAVAQSDSNKNRRYDTNAVQEACTFSGPNGTILRDTAQVTLVRPDLTPAITSIERPAENRLSVSVTMPDGGFVVASGPDPVGDPGEFPTAGESVYLDPGTRENVTVEPEESLVEMARDAPSGTVEVDVWLIRDANGNQQLDWSYNFPGDDWPYQTGDGTVVESVTLSCEGENANMTTT